MIQVDEFGGRLAPSKCLPKLYVTGLDSVCQIGGKRLDWDLVVPQMEYAFRLNSPVGIDNTVKDARNLGVGQPFGTRYLFRTPSVDTRLKRRVNARAFSTNIFVF
jgi:hypothetical protein